MKLPCQIGNGSLFSNLMICDTPILGTHEYCGARHRKKLHCFSAIENSSYRQVVVIHFGILAFRLLRRFRRGLECFDHFREILNHHDSRCRRPANQGKRPAITRDVVVRVRDRCCHVSNWKQTLPRNDIESR